MKKSIIGLMVSLLIITGLNMRVLADDYTATKSSILSSDEQIVTTTIEFTGPKTSPKVLFFLGTGCEAHGLSFSVIDNAMNSLLTKADVDLIQAADACYTYDGSYSDDGGTIYHKTSWNKGDTFTNVGDSSYEIKHGYHTLTKTGVQRLYEAISTTDYNFVVICYDGFLSGYFYHESYSKTAKEGYYHSYDYYHGNEEIYWKDSEIKPEDRTMLKNAAELLKDMNVVHLTAKASDDSYIFGDSKLLSLAEFDCGNVQYTGLSKYFDSSYKNSETVLDTAGVTPALLPRTEADQHYAARGMADLLAIIASDTWLKLVDDNGDYVVNELPGLSDIGFSKMDITDYANSSKVADNIDNLFNGVKFSIEDTVADGLTISKTILEKYDIGSSKWVEMSSGEYDILINGQKVAATVTYPLGTYYDGEMYRLTIISNVTDEFGDDGELTDTNNGEAKVQVINKNDEPFINESLESPEVKKTMLKVTFEDGDHGKIDGYYSKLYWAYSTNENKVKENSAKADDGYVFEGFKCKQNVTANGKTISTGQLIKADQLTDVLVDKDLDFVAIYSPIVKPTPVTPGGYVAPKTGIE